MMLGSLERPPFQLVQCLRTCNISAWRPSERHLHKCLRTLDTPTYTKSSSATLPPRGNDVLPNISRSPELTSSTPTGSLEGVNGFIVIGMAPRNCYIGRRQHSKPPRGGSPLQADSVYRMRGTSGHGSGQTYSYIPSIRLVSPFLIDFRPLAMPAPLANGVHARMFRTTAGLSKSVPVSTDASLSGAEVTSHLQSDKPLPHRRIVRIAGSDYGTSYELYVCRPDFRL